MRCEDGRNGPSGCFHWWDAIAAIVSSLRNAGVRKYLEGVAWMLSPLAAILGCAVNPRCIFQRFRQLLDALPAAFVAVNVHNAVCQLQGATL